VKPLLLGAAPLLEWFEAWIAQACCGSTARIPSAPSTGCCRLMGPPTSSSMSLAIARAKPGPGTLSSSRLPRRSASLNAPGITPGPSPSTPNLTVLSRIRALALRFQSNLYSRRERSKKQASQEQQHLRKIVFEIADSGQSLPAVNSGHHAEPELLFCSFHHKAPAPPDRTARRRRHSDRHGP
jgi:hypothetical protein